MGESNTLLYIIAAIVILHIVAGFGYMIYKMEGAPKTDKADQEE
ncbi:MAG: hypothetical protein R2824_15395 [Saprospiraceae bacterium]